MLNTREIRPNALGTQKQISATVGMTVRIGKDLVSKGYFLVVSRGYCEDGLRKTGR